MNRRKDQLSPQQFKDIRKLYRNNGLYQYVIAHVYGIDQSTVSRILSGKACSYHCMLKDKAALLKKNIKPSKNESKIACVLRAKRESLPRTKLTWEKATQIRELYFSGKITQVELAKMFHVHQCTISSVITGKNWKVHNGKC